MTSDKGKGEDLIGRVNHVEGEVFDPESPEQPTEPLDARTAEPPPEDERPRGRWAQLAARLTRAPDTSREAKSGERTRGLVILAGTTMVCIFLFFGLFTTDSTTNRKERKITPS